MGKFPALHGGQWSGESGPHRRQVPPAAPVPAGPAPGKPPLAWWRCHRRLQTVLARTLPWLVTEPRAGGWAAVAPGPRQE